MSKLLAIDDEEYMGWVIKKAFSRTDIKVVSTLTGKDGLRLIELEHPDLILLDLRLNDMDGLEILKNIKNSGQDIPVIIITAHGSIDTAIESMKSGAFDYITKPFDVDELIFTAQKALEVGRLKSEVNFLRDEVIKEDDNVLVNSDNLAMQEIYNSLPQIAQSDATVLITGESGTGKEVISRRIHKLSNRRKNSFVAVNCAAIPENLLESELFGYEKGAFTGAIQRKLGRFEMAEGGTIFLDEIGDISLSMQVKLLRVLQEKEFQRIGGNNNIKVNFRIIAATNKNLNKAIQEGTFREDLFYRINVIPLELPPLRLRREDIPNLAEKFIKKVDPQGRIKGISEEVIKLLCEYRWPGNIRELENVIERMIILSRDSILKEKYVPREILNSENNDVDEIVYFPKDGINLEKVEQGLLIKALNLSFGNQTKAAELLRITRSALIYRMQKYDIKFYDNMEENENEIKNKK